MSLTILNVIRDPPGFGGAETHLLEISKRLVARGHNVHVICGKTRLGLPDHEVIHGIHFHYLPLLASFLFRFKWLSFYLSRYLFYPATILLGRRIRQLAPDVIIDYVTPAPSFVYFLARQLGIPCGAEIMEYRGYREWDEVTDRVTTLLGYAAQNILFRRLRYQLIITISQATRRQLVRGGLPREAIKVAACGVNPADFNKHRPAAARRDNRLIIVGRLMPQKGHIYLFDALDLVRQQVPDIQLYVVGEGPEQPKLMAYARQQELGDHIIFTGQLAEREKIRLLWQSTLFVMPSLQEGFGIVLLEAMACGLPIVAFDLPAYREFMNEQCGLRVPRLNTRAMADGIVQLLEDDSTRAAMSDHNLVHVRQFDWNRAALLRERLLYQLAGREV